MYHLKKYNKLLKLSTKYSKLRERFYGLEINKYRGK